MFEKPWQRAIVSLLVGVLCVSAIALPSVKIPDASIHFSAPDHNEQEVIGAVAAALIGSDLSESRPLRIAEDHYFSAEFRGTTGEKVRVAGRLTCVSVWIEAGEGLPDHDASVAWAKALSQSLIGKLRASLGETIHVIEDTSEVAACSDAL